MPDALRDILQASLGAAFRIERELGGGGMSRVFVARDLALDRDVVVKVLPPDSTEGVSADRFRREIQLIARLQHPHIVSIISAGAADGVLYYVMPFVGGESVRARLTREGPFPVPDAVRILREVLDALAFAHRLGVIHRDIKPENVLLEAGHAVMADFGIAKALRESGTMTSVGTAVGTPAYMAPEQATGDPSTDHRADLYSVGVLAFELLTGTLPFTGSPQQLIVAHLTEPPPSVRDRRSDVPPALAELVDRLLAKGADQRPQSALETLAQLDSAVTPIATTPTGALTAGAPGGTAAPVATGTPAGTPVPAATTGPRRARLAIAVGAVAVAALATFGWWRARGDAPVVSEGAELIAVMPLAAVSDTTLARLGQDLVVTLSANFDGVGDLRTVDAVTLLMRARTLPQPIPIAEARALARELGARSVLTGTLIAEGAKVRASVTLAAVGADSTLAKATALAAPHEIAALTDSLTWAVLRQVWKRGTAPSPVLAGLTTRSFDALREFLEGERHFQRLETQEAMAAYLRAIEIDSTFPQALLRYDYVRSWSLQPTDEAMHRRLLAQAERLPERERAWLDVSDRPMTVPERITAFKALARRYPEYPPAIMGAADLIIHQGPVYGIPMAEADALISQLEVLVPDHGDTKFHRALVNEILASPERRLAALEAASRATANIYGEIFAADAELLRAQLEGRALPPVTRIDRVARAQVEHVRANEDLLALAGFLNFPGSPVDWRVDAVRHARRNVFPDDVARAASLGEGMVLMSRGDWAEGVRVTRDADGLALDGAARLIPARLAVLGAWVGGLDVALADSVLRAARGALPGDASPFDRIEADWLEGTVAVMTGDAARLAEARGRLQRDTLRVARNALRSLGVVALEREDALAAADSAVALSDALMQQGGFMVSFEAVDRFIAARGLVRRGRPADAERYLMWVDAAFNSARSMPLAFALLPLAQYERGVARDEAGDRANAVRHLRRFVDAYTRPPEAHRGLVEDAKRRLMRLEGGDR